MRGLLFIIVLMSLLLLSGSRGRRYDITLKILIHYFMWRIGIKAKPRFSEGSTHDSYKTFSDKNNTRKCCRSVGKSGTDCRQ